jgi:hypothetical protein
MYITHTKPLISVHQQRKNCMQLNMSCSSCAEFLVPCSSTHFTLYYTLNNDVHFYKHKYNVHLYKYNKWLNTKSNTTYTKVFFFYTTYTKVFRINNILKLALTIYYQHPIYLIRNHIPFLYSLNKVQFLGEEEKSFYYIARKLFSLLLSSLICIFHDMGILDCWIVHSRSPILVRYDFF